MTILDKETSRMEGLDALRGFALMGLFIVHMPELFELYWAHPVTDPVQLLWHDTVFAIFAGKAFALMALCFGVSFFILMDSAAKKGVDFTGRFVWRLAVLGIFGILHSIWYRGDILEVLALMGLFLLPFYRIKSNAILLALGTILLLQPLMWIRIIAGLNGAEWANQPLQFWSATIPDAYLTGGFAETIAANIEDGHSFKWLFMYESGRLSQILGLSLFGLVLGRIGFFSEPKRFRSLRLGGLGIAIVVTAALFHGRGALTELMPATEAMFMPRSQFGSIIGGLIDMGIMSVLLFGFTALYYGFGQGLLKSLAPAGRMTLTLYLAQSLVFVPVFYNYGLNQHATMSQSTAILLGIAAFLVQLGFAHLWFRHYRYGPLEWLWRAATYVSYKIPFKK